MRSAGYCASYGSSGGPPSAGASGIGSCARKSAKRCSESVVPSSPSYNLSGSSERSRRRSREKHGTIPLCMKVHRRYRKGWQFCSDTGVGPCTRDADDVAARTCARMRPLFTNLARSNRLRSCHAGHASLKRHGSLATRRSYHATPKPSPLTRSFSFAFSPSHHSSDCSTPSRLETLPPHRLCVMSEFSGSVKRSSSLIGGPM